MDPETVQLTKLQKAKVLGRAFLDVFPLVNIIFTLIFCSVVVANYIMFPAAPRTNPVILGIIMKSLIIFIVALVECLIIGAIMAFLIEGTKTFISNMKEKYTVESKKMKKEVLDNVIDDEILRK